MEEEPQAGLPTLWWGLGVTSQITLGQELCYTETVPSTGQALWKGSVVGVLYCCPRGQALLSCCPLRRQGPGPLVLGLPGGPLVLCHARCSHREEFLPEIYAWSVPGGTHTAFHRQPQPPFTSTGGPSLGHVAERRAGYKLPSELLLQAPLRTPARTGLPRTSGTRGSWPPCSSQLWVWNPPRGLGGP